MTSMPVPASLGCVQWRLWGSERRSGFSVFTNVARLQKVTSLSFYIFCGAWVEVISAAPAVPGPSTQAVLKPACLSLYVPMVSFSSKCHVTEGTLVARNRPWGQYLHHGNWRWLTDLPHRSPQSCL